MTDNTQAEALRLAALLDADEWPGSMTLVSYARACVAELCRQHARIAELEEHIEAIGAGGVQPLRKCLRHIEEPLEKVLERREAVIQILERDAHEAHQRAAHALGTRKVLWTLLGECSPLLHQLECNDHESEEQLNSLLRRIDDARAVVQAEELPNARP